jgi:protein TonB
MRNDLYIGALVALGAHAALALVNPAAKPARPPEKDDGVIVCEFHNPVEPPEPPPTPEVGDTSEVKETTVSAPRLPDVPRLAPSDCITMAPTVVPDGVQIDPGVVTIPTGGPRTPGGGSAIFEPGALDRAPVARFQAQPQYPFDMRRSGIAGEVLVEFIVEANGAVREARAVRSSQREFEAAAVQAVSKWTFRPGQKGGRTVATRIQVPSVFSLNAERD